MMGGKWGEGGDDDDEYATPQNTDHNTHGFQPNFHAPAKCSHWSSMHKHCCEGGPPPQPLAQAYRISSHHTTPRNAKEYEFQNSCIM